MDVLLFPYLPLDARYSIGGWELIPVAQLEEADVGLESMTELTRRLPELYEKRSSTTSAGAFAKKKGQVIGEGSSNREMRNLGRAVLAALLEQNPDVLVPEEEWSGNEGHHVLTSDNAVIYGHPLDQTGYVAVEYGALATTLVGGLNVNTDVHKIRLPAEIHFPLFGHSFDEYQADAVYWVIAEESDAARRIGRALDWLGLAWRNSVSMSLDLRIVALKTAFEVLLDAEDVQTLRSRLSELLDDEGAERSERVWDSRAGNPQIEEMTDLEWWFMEFAFLRNAIAHGEELGAESYQAQSGQLHFWIAEKRLREAITELVARAGFEEVRETRFHREVMKAIRQEENDRGSEETT